MMNQNQELFRRNALVKQAAKLDGAVLIARPLTANVLFIVLFAIILLGVVFLTHAQFHRKETVQGFIEPKAGVVKVQSNRSGELANWFVDEGQAVVAGEPIALINTHSTLKNGGDVSAKLIAQLEQQKKFVSSRINDAEQLFTERHSSLKVSENRTQSATVKSMLQEKLLQSRKTLIKDNVSRLEKLINTGAVSKLSLDNEQHKLLMIEQDIASHNIVHQELLEQLSRLELQTQTLPSEHRQAITRLQAENTLLEQQITQIAANESILITASTSGYVTNKVIPTGSSVSAGQSLVSVLPKRSEMKVILLVPSRAYCFIEMGQSTRIRIDAFPYQRFGVYEGEVEQTSQYLILPGEVSMPIAIDEPVYRVEVDISNQSISAYGQSVPLQPGMTISADIVLEERSLLSWLFEPIISLKGRV